MCLHRNTARVNKNVLGRVLRISPNSEVGLPNVAIKLEFRFDGRVPIDWRKWDWRQSVRFRVILGLSCYDFFHTILLYSSAEYLSTEESKNTPHKMQGIFPNHSDNPEIVAENKD